MVFTAKTSFFSWTMRTIFIYKAKYLESSLELHWFRNMVVASFSLTFVILWAPSNCLFVYQAWFFCCWVGSKSSQRVVDHSLHMSITIALLDRYCLLINGGHCPAFQSLQFNGAINYFSLKAAYKSPLNLWELLPRTEASRSAPACFFWVLNLKYVRDLHLTSRRKPKAIYPFCLGNVVNLDQPLKGRFLMPDTRGFVR